MEVRDGMIERLAAPYTSLYILEVSRVSLIGPFVLIGAASARFKPGNFFRNARKYAYADVLRTASGSCPANVEA